MLLEIKNLSVHAQTPQGVQPIISDVSLSIPKQSICALVGGSGSGKTTTGMSVVRLLGSGLYIVQGNIFFQGQNLVTMKDQQLRTIRGKDIAVIFQEPLLAFNPLMTIQAHMAEVFKAHGQPLKNNLEIFELLRLTGLKDPRRVADSYPHQLSGGMRQRAMIAQAIALKPKLIIADEPTSSLDVTLQAKIMALFKQLQKQLNVSILLITHDLGIVQHMADCAAVMSKGQLIEQGRVEQLIKNPQCEYTKSLLKAGV